MIQIRPRWPILATVVAALTYGANHYQLAGLEHIRLEARQATIASVEQVTQPQDEQALGIDNFALEGTPTKFPRKQTMTSSQPGWSQQLTVGEKLAMWADKLAANNQPAAPGSGHPPATQPEFSLPVSAPIPIPPGFIGFDNGRFSGDEVAVDVPAFEPPVIADGANQEFSASDFELSPVNAPIPDSRALQDSLGVVSELHDNRGHLTSAASFPSLRVASFNACSLGVKKFGQPTITETLTRIISQFDVVAIQEIQSSRDDLLPMFIHELNKSGRKYDYLIGPRVGRLAPQQQFAFVFDTERLETDRYQLYSVDDPQDLLNYEPLVAWFRCKEVTPEKAFTFSLINVKLDPNFIDAEIRLLPKLVETVLHDGRNEDDWILAGDFAGRVADDLELDGFPAVRRAIRDEATNVEGSKELDNLLFSARATVEYSGRSGVFDFLRAYNLALESALEISDHLPAWAEFSAVEGAGPGLIAQ